MEAYLYKARNMTTNKVVKGEIELENETMVRKFLIDKYLYPISIKRKNAFNSDLSEVGIFKEPIRLRDINFFCKQLAAMVQAGISIAKALDICGQQCVNKNLKRHLINIHEEVSGGKTFSEAVKEEGIFPDILVNMIECGEASGNLDEVLHQTVEHFDNQLGIRKKVKKALTYPVIVLVVVAIVVVILMMKVVPSFLGLLSETGAEIPVPTQIVIAVSDFFVNEWRILLGSLVVLVAAVLNMKRVPAIRKKLDHLALIIPLFGELNKKNLSAAFASTLSMLIESGIPMLQAMEITKKVMNNAVAEKEMDEAMETLKQGNSLLEAIKSSIIFPPILLSMVNIGEESGALDEMLIKISRYFKEEVELAVDSLTMLIEPAMTIMIAIVIGGIMLAIMLPTFAAATAVM